jgi:CBS domain containing-hemolysin-like protein
MTDTAMPDDHQSAAEDPSSSAAGPADPGSRYSLFQKFRTLFGARNASWRESLEGALENGGEGAADKLSAKERSMLRNVLDLRDLRIDDVMVPRADIDAIEIGASIGELLKAFRNAGHSRLPVYRESLDEPMGMVHIKDVVNWMTTQAELDDEERASRRTPPANGLELRKVALKTPLAKTDLVRDVLFVPTSMPAGDLLVKMQANRIHLAIVVDEYGGTDGLVSIEDLVEEIVGDIEDEHDEESAPMIVPTEDGGFIADARAPLEDIGAALGAGLDIGDLVEEIDTLGGLVFNQAGRVPVRGELVAFPGGYEFEILDADPRRVKRVRIHRRQQDGERVSARPRQSGGHPDAA